jgi:hypothetical protein
VRHCIHNMMIMLHRRVLGANDGLIDQRDTQYNRQNPDTHLTSRVTQ